MGKKKGKKKEGNVAVQLYKVAVGAGHSRAICDCHGSLLPLIAWNKAPPWLTQAGHRRSRVWRDTRWQCFQKDAPELRGAEDSQLWHLVGTLGKGLCEWGAGVALASRSDPELGIPALLPHSTDTWKCLGGFWCFFRGLF